MVKYDYIPEDKLVNENENKGFYFKDGGYDFEIINVIEGVDGKDDRVEMFLEGNGRSGKKSAFFGGNPRMLWYLISYLKSIDRMDLYSTKGVTDLTKTISHKGFLLLKTKFSENHGKEFQNIEFVPWNKHMESNETLKKKEVDKSWKEVEDDSDDIPF